MYISKKSLLSLFLTQFLACFLVLFNEFMKWISFVLDNGTFSDWGIECLLIFTAFIKKYICSCFNDY